VKPRLFNLATALSLLLCLAVCTLWLRSYWSQEKLTWITVNGYRSIWTAKGSVELGLLQGDGVYKPNETASPKYSRDSPNSPFNGLLFLDFDYPITHTDWQHAGFAWHEVRETATGHTHAVAFAPFWSLALLTSLLPLAWLASRRRTHHRQESGLCPTCGYDLRATPDRCPECGTVSLKQ
jgi:hypothetical protein